MSKFIEFVTKNKHILDPAVDAVKAKLADLIEKEFQSVIGDGGTVPSNIKEKIVGVISHSGLPILVLMPAEMAVMAFDFSKYTGKPVAQLTHAKDDLIAHVKASHL